MNPEKWKVLAMELADKRPETPRIIKNGLYVQGRRVKHPKTQPVDENSTFDSREFRKVVSKVVERKVAVSEKTGKFVHKFVDRGYKPVFENITGTYGDKAWGRGVPYPKYKGRAKGSRKGGKNVPLTARFPTNIGRHVENQVKLRHQARIDMVISMVGKIAQQIFYDNRGSHPGVIFAKVVNEPRVKWLFLTIQNDDMRVRNIKRRIRCKIRGFCEQGK